MKKYDLLNDDLVHNPRSTESSARVIAWWTLPEDAYLPVLPPEGHPQETQFASLTAERIFFREKILENETVAPELRKNRLVLSAPAFGKRTPPLRELLKPDVSAAMAYFPVASMASKGNNTLARLYCVNGLGEKSSSSLTMAGVEGAEAFSWFIGGIEERVYGDSLQLAAAVLVRAFRDFHASSEIRRRLVKEFVFTGIVGRRGVVERIDRMPEKATLAKIPEYEKLEWVVPKDNVVEAGRIKKKTFISIEDVCAYVFRRGEPTETLVSLVKDGAAGRSLKSIYRCLRDGADANAPFDDGRNVRQMIMSNIQRKIVGLIRQDGLKDKPVIEIQNAVRGALAPEWDAEKASSYYGNDPLLFFLAARNGDDVLLRSLRASMDIDAVDRDGETALDFALETGDKDVAGRLRRFGAKRRGIYSHTSKRMRAFFRDPEVEWQKDGGKFVMTALDEGLDPLAEISFGTDETGKDVERVRKLWDNTAADPDPWNSDREPWVDHPYTRTSVLKEAIFAKNLILVKKSLEILKSLGKEIPSEYVSLALKYSSSMIAKSLREYGK